MELDYTLELEDLIASAAFLRAKFKPKVNGNLFWYYLLPLLLCAVTVETGSDFGVMAAIFGTFLALYFVWQNWAKRKNLASYYSPENTAGLTGQHKIILSPDWLTVKNETSEKRFRWSCVSRILYTEAYLFIYLNNIQAFPIPRVAFQNESQFQEFRTELESRIRTNRAAPGTDINSAV